MTFSKTFSAIVVAIALLPCLACQRIRNNSLINTGNQLVTKIRTYKNDKGTLPSTLEDLGIEEKLEGPIYYRKESESKYIVWFGNGLGESVTYDSESNKWQPGDIEGPKL
jgi:hypothetical protein